MYAPDEQSDGIDLLPDQPGIYCILNRVNGRRMVGMAGRSVQHRAKQHRQFLKRPTGPEVPLVRDLRLHGPGAFMFLTLEVCQPSLGTNHRGLLRSRELWWARQLCCLDERTGYNLEAGGVRSPASRLRDLERKLAYPSIRKFELLPGTDASEPINPGLLATWLQEYQRSLGR